MHVDFSIKKYIVLLCDSWYENMFSQKPQLRSFRRILTKILRKICKVDATRCLIIVDRILQSSSESREILLEDAESVLQHDPAANSIQEIIQCYPGIYTLAIYRLSHILYMECIDLLPRMLSEYAHTRTGIDIHPGAQIGKRFFMDHATGIVIGETTEIHDDVKIYQGVTLGALQVNRSLKASKRHPTIEKNVTIYAQATILGGDTVIGENSVIGGNVFLTKSIPPNSTVKGLHEVHIKTKDG